MPRYFILADIATGEVLTGGFLILYKSFIGSFSYGGVTWMGTLVDMCGEFFYIFEVSPRLVSSRELQALNSRGPIDFSCVLSLTVFLIKLFYCE